MFCPTSQTDFAKTKKRNANKVPATVHGVVFEIFLLPGRERFRPDLVSSRNLGFAVVVMTGLDPAIQGFRAAPRTWMPGTRLRQGFAGLPVLGRRSFSEDGKPRA
ncbi:hypothetical protein AC630_23820 [Bradyrhizobium sp. AS23.2]|nr:hypothetical protein AC630_23820 [Bradyrhizobium sp. AS23.2]